MSSSVFGALVALFPEYRQRYVRPALAVELVQRTEFGATWQVGHMQIGKGHFYMGMPQKFFEAHDIHPIFQQVCGKTVAQHVGCDLFVAAYFRAIFFDYPTDAIGGQSARPAIFGNLTVK